MGVGGGAEEVRRRTFDKICKKRKLILRPNYKKRAGADLNI